MVAGHFEVGNNMRSFFRSFTKAIVRLKSAHKGFELCPVVSTFKKGIRLKAVANQSGPVVYGQLLVSSFHNPTPFCVKQFQDDTSAYDGVHS